MSTNVRVYTEWSGPPVALRAPRKGSQTATVDVRCHVRGCDEPAAWWRTVHTGAGALGASLCEAHVECPLVTWQMPPYPPLVIVTEQLTIGGVA